MKTAVLYLMISVCFVTSAWAEDPQTFATVLKREGIIRIIRDERTRFSDQLATIAKVRPLVTDSFDATVVQRVSSVQIVRPATPAAAETALRVRFRFFLGNLTTYLLATKQDVIFDEKSLESYLNAAARAGRCGESPCAQGCADEMPCDESCNPCPSGQR